MPLPLSSRTRWRPRWRHHSGPSCGSRHELPIALPSSTVLGRTSPSRHARQIRSIPHRRRLPQGQLLERIRRGGMQDGRGPIRRIGADMTFSISARCEDTGMFGIAVSSSSPAVAARCAHARAGAGVVASQNITDPRLGPKGLDLMQSGVSAAEALEKLKADAPHLEYRQLALVDRNGGTASFSGAHTLGTHAVAAATNAVAAGNLLANEQVPARMIEEFQKSRGKPLGERLIGVMQAGLAAGGEAGPVHSAGMLLGRDVEWPVAELRGDWSGDPIGGLGKLWQRGAPEMDADVSRGLSR